MSSKLKIVAFGWRRSALSSTLRGICASRRPSAPRRLRPRPCRRRAASPPSTINWQAQPIWFRGGVDNPAVAQLVTILQRAPFDGFADGPATRRPGPGRGRAGSERQARRHRAAAERCSRPPGSDMSRRSSGRRAGMIYAFPVLQPQGTRADQILLTAAAAPSLEAYLVATVERQSRSTRRFATPPGRRRRRPAISRPIRACSPISTACARSPRAAASCSSIPARQMLTLYENGQPVDSMKVIVGKTEYADADDRQHHVLHRLQSRTGTRPIIWSARRSRRTYLSWAMSYLKIARLPGDGRTGARLRRWSPSDQVDWKAAAAGKLHLRIRQNPRPTKSAWGT